MMVGWIVAVGRGCGGVGRCGDGGVVVVLVEELTPMLMEYNRQTTSTTQYCLQRCNLLVVCVPVTHY